MTNVAFKSSLERVIGDFADRQETILVQQIQIARRQEAASRYTMYATIVIALAAALQFGTAFAALLKAL